MFSKNAVDLCSKPDLHDCVEICVSSVDSFNCSCPVGEYGDGRKSGTGCTPRNSGHRFPLTKVAVGINSSSFFVGVSYMKFYTTSVVC